MTRAEKHRTYASVCRRLSSLGRLLGIQRRRSKPGNRTSERTGRRADSRDKLDRHLELAGLHLTADEVRTAGDTASAMISAALLATCALIFTIGERSYFFAFVAAAIVLSFIGRELVLSHPARLATRKAEQVLKHSTEATNLMIMSLRHEPSVSRAIGFASARDDEFSTELRACTWGVIMGKFESFEEALLNLGDKWAAFGEELKTSFNSMVTSSREATQDGRRRALDRANQAMIAGGKRRIEAYALSLSTPSMMIFGLGILLPLMVGSFLPMLSWDLWSMDNIGGEPAVQTRPQSTSQMVFLMNLVFPSIALLIAAGAVSNHPLESTTEESERGYAYSGSIIGILAASSVIMLLEWRLLEASVLKSIVVLFSGVAPVSLLLLARSRKSRHNSNRQVEDTEDVLFRTGARMLEGENFESSLHRAANDRQGGSDSVRKTSFRWILDGGSQGSDSSKRVRQPAMQNAMHGLEITREAAAKDETAAGMLAMDLASYLKDLRDLESSLKNRLKPTISMMKTTALLMAPVVLGVTYAIYLSLASMLGPSGESSDAGIFFIVLGVFLAEIDAVVVYFVWGIEGKIGYDSLLGAIGGYIVVSEIVYSTTALIASR